jgi:hypothetical protein
MCRESKDDDVERWGMEYASLVLMRISCVLIAAARLGRLHASFNGESNMTEQ